MLTAPPGVVLPWRQRVIASGPDASTAYFEVTPSSGSVEISYVEDDGTQKWWDGAAFDTPKVTLATTINGKVSEYLGFTPTKTEMGKVIRFEGWIAGDKTTLDRCEVLVSRVEGATLHF